MNDAEDPDIVSKPAWDSSQLHMRTWLDELAFWLSTQLSDYATLVEHGFVKFYVPRQGRNLRLRPCLGYPRPSPTALHF
eukprot:6194302-Pleurochrysis_carterae.AAC.1